MLPHSSSGLLTDQRRYDLDWLRIIAILLLHFFHTGMMFTAEWGWHIKNNETSHIFLEWMYFLSRWRMALLFFISGVGTAYALGFRRSGTYIKERARRLLIPLIFGMFVVVPPQIYFERLFRGQKFSSILEFYPSVFQFVPYPEGNFSWHHLWFIAYLFLYSLLALPLFLYLRSEKGKTLVNALSKLSIYIFGLPLAMVYVALLVAYPPGNQNLISDWAMFCFYFLLFVSGYIIHTHQSFWQQTERKRKLSLKLGFISIVVINFLRWNDLEPEWSYNWANSLFLCLLAFNSWFWVLAILGYGKHYLNRKNKLLAYANEAIYPFYILHQTFIVVIGYYVIQLQEDIGLKFVFTIVVTFLLSMGTYEFFIKPYRITRLLFGMKEKKAKPIRKEKLPLETIHQ
jgi:hypothetical protein